LDRGTISRLLGASKTVEKSPFSLFIPKEGDSRFIAKDKISRGKHFWNRIGRFSRKKGEIRLRSFEKKNSSSEGRKSNSGVIFLSKGRR